MLPKILVVDDEPDLELLIKQKFRREIKEGKYDFTFAKNGLQALEKINEDNGIELVLTDINMPEMDGLTLLSKIKEMNNPLLHSVIVSAYGDIINIRTAMNGGAFDFIVKPIDLQDLEITIQKAITNLASFKKALLAREELIAVRKELEEARSLQLSMLPKEVPANGDLNIGVFMKTASEVGGDYYDFSRKPDGSLNIAIGDATGHGMKAGIMVSIMKALFISDSTDMELHDFFNVSNTTIKALNLGRMMMAFAMLSIKDNKLSFINAGMPSLYLYRKSNGEVEEFETQGLPLGAINESRYSKTEIELESGDTILLLSDAFAELMNANNELYSYERVITEFRSNAGRKPEELIRHLNSEAERWLQGGELVDDITFIVIKVE